jgi:hypothetical protein
METSILFPHETSPPDALPGHARRCRPVVLGRVSEALEPQDRRAVEEISAAPDEERTHDPDEALVKRLIGPAGIAALIGWLLGTGGALAAGLTLPVDGGLSIWRARQARFWAAPLQDSRRCPSQSFLSIP